MQIRLIRSATLVVDVAGSRLLIDPWLAKKGEGKTIPVVARHRS